FSIAANEIVGLLGPNGAGKTTAFYIAAGIIFPSTGQIFINNEDVTDKPMHARANLGLGYLPQEPSIFRRLTVRENLLAVLEAVPGLDRAAREQRADDMLDKFGITHKSADYGYSLSGGERRRVEIARAVSLQPSFMLLDEPFAGIDPISIIDIQRLISDLKAMGIGVLITDHNVRETLGICDRAYILTQGRVLTEGTAEHILAHEEVRSVYLGTGFRL
ncbi:MAG: LPS export ABC transporter ATP-binding protein, partial [Gammaproteobacteria bacterium]